jgi:hypothetical protein
MVSRQQRAMMKQEVGCASDVEAKIANVSCREKEVREKAVETRI